MNRFSALSAAALLALFAISVQPASAAPRKGARHSQKASKTPSRMISEAPFGVVTGIEMAEKFMQAWKSGNRRVLARCCARNIGSVYWVDFGNEAKHQDVSQEDFINMLLDRQSWVQDYELISAAYVPLNNAGAKAGILLGFKSGKMEDGKPLEIHISIVPGAEGRISDFIVSRLPQDPQESYGEIDEAIVLKGVHMSSADTPTEMQEDAPVDVARLEDPLGIGTWGGIDANYETEKLVKKAVKGLNGYVLATRCFANYAQMRQLGTTSTQDFPELADEVTLLGKNVVLTREELTKLVSQSHLMWPCGTWPIRMAAEGDVLRCITKVIAPGFEDPVFLKTTLVLGYVGDGMHEVPKIIAIGETQCVKTPTDNVEGKRLEFDVEKASTRGKMKAFHRSMMQGM